MITIKVKRGSVTTKQKQKTKDHLFELPKGASLDAAVPRALRALDIAPSDSMQYFLAPDQQLSSKNPAKRPSESNVLNNDSFARIVKDYVDDTDKRYLRIATSKRQQLSSELAAALKSQNSPSIDAVIMSIQNFVSHPANYEASADVFLVHQIIETQCIGISDGICQSVILRASKVLRTLMKHMPASIVNILLETQMHGMRKYKNGTERNNVDSPNTLILFLNTSLNTILKARNQYLNAMSLKASTDSFKAEIAANNLKDFLVQYETVVAQIFAMVLSEISQMSQENPESLNVLKNNINSAISDFVIGIIGARDNTKAIVITAKAFGNFLMKMPKVKQHVDSKGMVIKILPLLRFAKQEALNDLLILLSVLDYLTDPNLVHGLFQIIRAIIPHRIMSIFFPEDFNSVKSVNKEGASEIEVSDKKGEVNETDFIENWELTLSDVHQAIESNNNRKTKAQGKKILEGKITHRLTAEGDIATPDTETRLYWYQHILRTASFLIWRAFVHLCDRKRAGLQEGITASESATESLRVNAKANSSLQRNIDPHDEQRLSRDAYCKSETIKNDMKVLIIMSRIRSTDMRACALGALSVICAEEELGNAVYELEQARLDTILQFRKGQSLTFEYYYTQCIANDTLLCSLMACNVIAALISRPHHSIYTRSPENIQSDSESMTIRRRQMARNKIAIKTIFDRMMKEEQNVAESIFKRKQQEALVQGLSFILCELCLVPYDALENRHDMYQYAIKMIVSVDYEVARNGGNALASLIQNEPNFYGFPEQNIFMTIEYDVISLHIESTMTVVDKLETVITELERASSIITGTSLDLSIQQRVTLIESLLHALHMLLYLGIGKKRDHCNSD